MTFEEHVQRALDELPPHLAEKLDNVAVVVEEEAPGDPDLFGLWEAPDICPPRSRSSAGRSSSRFRIPQTWRGDQDHRVARAGALVRAR